MKLSLLDIVQDILSEMDSDEVNSINDTIESEQVAQIVKSTYLEMMSNRNWPHLSRLVQMVAYGDSTKPTHVKLPEYTKELKFINYDIRKDGETRRKYQPMRYYEPVEFLQKINGRNSDEDNHEVVADPTGVEVIIRNDKEPEFFTSFDDEVLVFDSYDKTTSNTLMTSRFQCQAVMMPTWVHADDHIPDLPSEAFMALQEEAKSTAFLTLKQMGNEKAEQKARRQQRWLAQKAWAVSDLELYPDFGRKPKGSLRNPYIDKDNKTLE
jgi:hypothetical protein